MNRRKKLDVSKNCQQCGSPLSRKTKECIRDFLQRMYCDRLCAGAARAARPKRTTDPSLLRRRARELVPPGPCEECGAPSGRDVHHRDGDHANNARANLQRLCRSCHMRHHRPKGNCKVCGGQVQANGYCAKHGTRFKKYGNPYLVKVGASRFGPGVLKFSP